MGLTSLVSIDDLSKTDILSIMELAARFEACPNQYIMQGKVVASLFFEPSTRTRLSFESAINRLGGRVIGLADANTSSSSKGETLRDTIKMVANYSDLIIMRHPREGAAKFASELTDIPIINAGDGSNQHPTQTLLDLYSILKTQGTLENLEFTMVGDLKYGRTVHSLTMALSHFSPKFNFVSHPELKMPKEYCNYLKDRGIDYSECSDMEACIKNADILYMTRVQKERFSDPMEYEKTKNAFILKASMLDSTKDSMKVLHPLPRVNEIEVAVDSSPKAYYFTQSLNGVYTRQAIISHLLGYN
jgi:aspartate carbamoyltransferase catalytic subunit